MSKSFPAGVQFGKHAAGDDLRLLHGGDLSECEPTHYIAIGAFDAGNVGEEDEGVGLGADGAGCGHLVGVDVVVLTVEAEGDGGDDGNCAHGPDGLEPLGIHGGDLAYEAEVRVGFFLASTEDVTVAAGEADCRLPVRADGGDEGFVDSASEDHERGIAGFGVGDSQARDKLALLAHEGQGTRELHATTVDDGYLIAIGDQVGDGFAAGVEDLLVLKSGTA